MSTNLSIPSLGVRVDTLTAAGFSSGGFMTNYMMLTDPQLFAGAGSLNAGPPETNTKQKPKQWGSIPEDIDIDQYMGQLIGKVERKDIGDLDFLDGKPVYIFMGESDNVIPHQWTETMRDLYMNLRANVKFESKPNYGHFAPLDPGRYLNKYLYENIPGSGFGAKNPWNEKPDEEWMKNGYFGKFDQSLYTNGRDPAAIGLREWGFFFYPEECIQGGCNMQIVYHGCKDPAEKFLMQYAPWAAVNKLVLIAPQAAGCWAVHGYTKTPKDPKTYFTKEDPQYLFSTGLILAAS